MGAIGVPSGYLFAALLVGLAVALTRPAAIDVPGGAFMAAQALTGVTLGGYLDSSSLRAIGDSWVAVALVSAGTLAGSLAVGLLLARLTSLDAPTAALGMIAGGASGIVTMAHELGGDDRLVAFMQYARVLVVVLVTPLLVPLAFPGEHGGPAAPGAGEPLLGSGLAWLVTPAVALAGALAGRRLRVPAPMLLGPMILAGALTLSGLGGEALTVPPLARETAFAVIGLQVGLR